MAICATVIIGGGGEGARGALAGGRSELIGQGSDGDLCSSFSDPAECRAFRDKAKHRYWTEGETRSELWKVMKGVAMMDEKMNAADKAHSHAFDSQKRSVAHASRCCCCCCCCRSSNEMPITSVQLCRKMQPTRHFNIGRSLVLSSMMPLCFSVAAARKEGRESG